MSCEFARRLALSRTIIFNFVSSELQQPMLEIVKVRKILTRPTGEHRQPFIDECASNYKSIYCHISEILNVPFIFCYVNLLKH